MYNNEIKFSKELSVVVPLFNEEESLPELVEWVDRVCKSLVDAFEIILIDDGSSDRSWAVIQELTKDYSHLKGISFRRNYGKSAALNCGFREAAGEVVITMDADLQDNPDEIPELYKLIKENDYQLVSGWKKKRYDPLGKTIPSKLFNYTARMVSGIKLHDFNCGLKAYHGNVIKNIEVYGEMHRYIPILAKRAGFSRIGEKVVMHRERKYGVTKFGIERFIKGFLDLLSVMFISKFGDRPMHLFGSLGTLTFTVGFFSALWLGIRKLWFVYFNVEAPRVTDSPYFYISLTCMILGTQLFMTGFIAELVSRMRPDRNEYQIKQKTSD
ncbi:glycosyltransferase family 2 protein [Alkalitalea saponilacus]|uniref:Glycosyltransferase involved in cell wall bisynthesis n=1 Tax=Alkalitalea saponilacus TaxID=889453 RepID=A0A1T5GSU2_9BACT|nr:glycosyltransferase family 2 protein [Alkalitalea saponilacus]ASB48203.1 glycosyltransferase [Alkalitalea saponilacus]SKC11483.1 Glycosyltransferase involved in cell wall bisynthesis [Alkalitalea saponilacus]